MKDSDSKKYLLALIQAVLSGKTLAVTLKQRNGNANYLIPRKDLIPANRQLGILQHKGQVTLAADFKLTDDEFLGL